jgi:putative PIN family toxin of toxin-antitoxin system
VPSNTFRLVLDTNVLVRAFINRASDSGELLHACERRRVVPLLSTAVLREYRLILRDPMLCLRYPQLSKPDVAVALERLIYVSDVYRRVRAKFEFPRDPKDSQLIELAIVGNATHLITSDDDLIALPQGRTDASNRFRQRLPRIQIVKPFDFVRQHRGELGLG